MRRRVLWWTIVDSHVVEAVSTKYDVRLRDGTLKLFLSVGKQAMDALGVATSSCQTVELAIGLIREFVPLELIPEIDPWWPKPKPDMPRPKPGPDPGPWFSLEPILPAALGGAIVALREHFLETDREGFQDREEEFDEIARGGVEVAVTRAIEGAAASARRFEHLLAGRGEESS